MSFQTLLENVVTFEAAIHGTGVTRDRYLEIGTDLYEWHLPVLVDVGLVDLDDRHDTVRYLGDPLLNFWLREVRSYELRG